MATQTETKKGGAPAPAASGRPLEKISVDIVKMKVGQTVEGTLVGKTSGPWEDEDGNMKELVRLHFVRDDKTRFIVFEDSGLRNALSNAMVKDGDYIAIEKLEKQAMSGGRTVNSYNVFGLAKN